MAAVHRAARASDRVHDAIRADLLAGALAPGDVVPSERALAERFAVNRQSVREALKRLEQAGLVRISHGGATRVLDWRDTAGLELLTDLVAGGHAPPSPDLVRAIVEMRASIGIDAARRCAARADSGMRANVRALAEEAAALVGGDVGPLEERYAAMWQTIVAGSGNIAYRLAFNALLRSLESYPDLAAVVRPTEAPPIRALGTAIARGHARAATRHAARLLEPAADRTG